MLRYFLRSRFAVVLLVFFITLIPAGANPFLDRLYWDIRGTMLFLAAKNGSQGADPFPILPSLGASASWKVAGPLWVEAAEDIYFTNYEYNAEYGYPMASNPENRSAFVMGFITGLQATGNFPIGKTGIGIRGYGGLTMDIRLVMLAFGLKHPADFTGELETDARMQTDAIRKYFWSEGRWFYPVAGIGVDFPVNDKFLLGIDFRTWFPLYRMWTDRELPSIDGWRFGIGFRLTPRKTKSPKQNHTDEQIIQPVNEPVNEPSDLSSDLSVDKSADSSEDEHADEHESEDEQIVM